jgi:hypothetical protein
MDHPITKRSITSTDVMTDAWSRGFTYADYVFLSQQQGVPVECEVIYKAHWETKEAALDKALGMTTSRDMLAAFEQSLSFN